MVTLEMGLPTTCRLPRNTFHSVPRCSREREGNFASPDWIELLVVVVFCWSAALTVRIMRSSKLRATLPPSAMRPCVKSHDFKMRHYPLRPHSNLVARVGNLERHDRQTQARGGAAGCLSVGRAPRRPTWEVPPTALRRSNVKS
jgi:hypothetical protein